MKAVFGLGVALSLVASAPLRAAAPPLAAPTLEQRVQILERKAGAISDLLLRLDALQREVQQLRGEVELQNHAMDALKKRQRDLYLDVDQRLSRIDARAATPAGAGPKLAQPGPVDQSLPAPVSLAQPVVNQRQAGQPGSAQPVVNQPPGAQPTADAPSAEKLPQASQPAPGQVEMAAPAQPAGDPAQEDAAYQAAFKLLMQRRYDEAKMAFSAFLASYPTGNYADNAQYWLAEASYVTRQFDVALAEFAKVMERYPQSPKVPDALLKTGFIQYELKAWADARATLQALVERYPNTTASRLAQKRLDRMRSEGR